MKKMYFFILLTLVFFPVSQLSSQSIQFGNINNWNKFPYKTATFDGGNYRLIWSVQGDTIYMGISAKTTGWVAIGLGSKQAMDKADIIFCRVLDSGKVDVTDTFSTGPYGPHPPDTELGGTSDILSKEGIEKNGITTVTFSRRLNTGDNYDKKIPKDGKLKIIWAYGADDDINTIHESTGYAVMDIAAGTFAFNRKLFILIHAVLMSLAFLFILTGMLIARYLKKKKIWLKIHKTFGITGGLLGIAGFSTAYYMIANTSRIHFSVLHTFAGLTGIIMLILTPILGQTFLKIRKHKQFFRAVHKFFGRITLIIVFAAIIFGLFKAGIL